MIYIYIYIHYHISLFCDDDDRESVMFLDRLFPDSPDSVSLRQDYVGDLFVPKIGDPCWEARVVGEDFGRH